jgi:hypothetical protein
MARREDTLMDEWQWGQPLAFDHKAASASPTKLAFAAPSERAPVYHGFGVLDDVVVDGFTLGKISDWEAEPFETGDAFVIAPDRSRAGPVWQPCDPPYPKSYARWAAQSGRRSGGTAERFRLSVDPGAYEPRTPGRNLESRSA